MSFALALTLVRLALAPVVVVLGATHSAGWTVAVAIVVGFLSDIFDGVVARRTGRATAALRRLDSAADTVFYLAVAGAAWLLFPRAIPMVLPWIGVVVATEILTSVVCWLRFRREASYHSLSARLFGVALLVATLTLFLTGSAALIPIAAAIGVLSHVENVAITLTLAEWRHDVRSLAAARRIRRAAVDAR